MTGTFGVVLFFVALIVAIVIHEAGHFFVAKAFDFKVEEFFVGFGPRLWSFRRGETEYGVKAVPAGGYVKIAGMNPFKEPNAEDRPRTYGAKPRWQRALVILAGPATHFVVAFVLVAVYLGVVGTPTFSPLIARVEPRLNGEVSPAAAAGLRDGDEVVGIGPIDRPDMDEFSAFTRSHIGRRVDLRVLRDGEVVRLSVRPVLAPGEGGELFGRIGTLVTGGRSLGRDRAGPVATITGSGRWVGQAVVQSVEGLKSVFGPEGLSRLFGVLFQGRERQLEGPVSVIGIGQVAGQTAQRAGFAELLVLLAAVNVFLGLINLVPLPPFDGGHIAVLAIEKIRRRAIDQRKLIPVAAFVLSFFALFTLAAVYLDLVKPIELVP